jgi:hypothetical protein
VLADLLAGTPVLPTPSAQSLWLGALGAVITACYIFGLLAHIEKKVLGLGPDSLVVLFTYIGVSCYSPTCLDDARACCPSSAQVLPKFCPRLPA